MSSDSILTDIIQSGNLKGKELKCIQDWAREKPIPKMYYENIVLEDNVGLTPTEQLELVAKIISEARSFAIRRFGGKEHNNFMDAVRAFAERSRKNRLIELKGVELPRIYLPLFRWVTFETDGPVHKITATVEFGVDPVGVDNVRSEIEFIQDHRRNIVTANRVGPNVCRKPPDMKVLYYPWHEHPRSGGNEMEVGASEGLSWDSLRHLLNAKIASNSVK